MLSLQRSCSLNSPRTIQKKSQNLVSTVDAQQLWEIFLSTIECSSKCYNNDFVIISYDNNYDNNYYHMKLLQNHPCMVRSPRKLDEVVLMENW